MFIESPHFVHRNILNSRLDGQTQPNSPPYQYGKQRNQLIRYVTNALNRHQKDEEILQKFRNDAEQIKKKKFHSKRYNSIHSEFPNSEKIALPSIAPLSYESHHQEQQTPKKLPIAQQDVNRRNQQQNHLLEHSNRLIEKYGRLLGVKEKEIKRKDRQLERSKYALEKMTHRVKYLQKVRMLTEKAEDTEFMKIQHTLKEMNQKLALNKNQLLIASASCKESLNISIEPQKQYNYSQVRNKTLLKPNPEQLQLIKRKAKSLKKKKEQDPDRSPSVFYQRLSTDPGSSTHSNHLERLNRSIIKQSCYDGMVV